MKLLAALCLSAALLCASAEESVRLRLEAAQLAARAGALLSVVRDTEDRLHAQGFSLHPNIVEARILVEMSVDAVQTSVRAREWSELPDRISSLRGSLEVLRRRM